MLQHELQHVERDDFYNDLTISEVEGKKFGYDVGNEDNTVTAYKEAAGS